MKYEIKNRFTGEVIFSHECDSWKICVEAAIKSRANLSGANLSRDNLSGANLSRADLSSANLPRADLSCADLSYADLSCADLSYADLSGADLSGADLSGANLSRADLPRADLSCADLSGANLSCANLSSADLSSANLSRADLSSANLPRADLSGANLPRADLYRANLSGANLPGTDLSGAKNTELVIARTRILPEGQLIGWKKATNGAIVKLSIPPEAKRSSAFGRKCRCEFADVIEIIGAGTAYTNDHGPRTEYIVGQRVFPDYFDENWQDECSHGIHFFITRLEAETY